jgi:hypothetical protein
MGLFSGQAVLLMVSGCPSAEQFEKKAITAMNKPIIFFMFYVSLLQ